MCRVQYVVFCYSECLECLALRCHLYIFVANAHCCMWYREMMSVQTAGRLNPHGPVLTWASHSALTVQVFIGKWKSKTMGSLSWLDSGPPEQMFDSQDRVCKTPQLIWLGFGFQIRFPHTGRISIKEVMTRSMVNTHLELRSPFFRVRHSTTRISVTRITTVRMAQIEIKWDLVMKT